MGDFEEFAKLRKTNRELETNLSMFLLRPVYTQRLRTREMEPCRGSSEELYE